MGDEKDFKVVDKRSSVRAGEGKDAPEKRGEGFVMNEPPKDQEPGPTQVDFSTLVLSLATGALINMGFAPDPITKKVTKNLELAKQNVDILSLLREKTKGNLTPEESKLMENLLTEVRLRFVEASR